ncbi:MAG: FkbM family methyltransferase [Gammaproteobacteria bacterium]|jgi:FkbM family methyltransferase
MNKIKEILKFKLLPKKHYLRYSAKNKLRRVKKKKETELLLLPYLIDKNKDAVDAGANTGLYTYFLSHLVKNVYAFEPHTNLASFLDKATNNKVTVINKALSNTQSLLPFYIPVTGTRKHLNIASLDKKIKNNYQCLTENIQTITLDELGYNNIGFIKIDVEGHELCVLEGAVNTIKDQKPTILIEILDIKDNPGSHQTIKFLNSLGYEIFVMQNEQLQHINNVDHKRLDRNYICFAT